MSNWLISLGTSASDAYPQRIGTTWPAFVAYVSGMLRRPAGLTPAEYAHLKTFPTKSPEGQRIAADKDGAYVVLADFGGHRRAYDTLLHSSGVPLDFDSGHITADSIAATLHGYAYVAFTTYAHRPGAERWRVFVPTAAPMDAATHAATWHALNLAFGGAADGAAKDATRLSYLPGSTLIPEAARCFSADGAMFAPVPAAPPAPSVAATESSGPVEGWGGPTDDDELLAIACATRTRPDERFGGPIHFAMLWGAVEEWLAAQFPSNTQPWDYTKADMALAGELAYWTGNDRDRMAELLRRSGLATVRGHDEDWTTRKVALVCERAIANAKQWAFIGTVDPRTLVEQPPDVVATLTVDGVPVPPALSHTEAALANAPKPGSMPGLNDYWAYLPNAQFIHRPTGMLHVASSVDGTIGPDARKALVVSRPVHRMTWAPGRPERFQTKDIDATDERGAESWMYNKYQPPKAHVTEGDVTPWLDLLQRLYPDDWQHIRAYFADAVQHADKKCNHALVLGSGVHGIGKDTLLAPVRFAVGERNFWVIKPMDLVGDYNPWVATRILQISESRDLGEGANGVSRYEMYERMKDLCAAPPVMLPCVDKYINQHMVLNVLRPILTTNHGVDGIFLPPEDRRHYCAWSDAPKMLEGEANALWAWYAAGGMDYVAHYLTTFDLADFNRSAPPPQTAWWRQLVEGGRPSEDERVSDAVTKLGTPDWLTVSHVAEAGGLELAGWMALPGNRRKLERLMDSAGYRRLANPNDVRGRWFINGQRVIVYRRFDVQPNTLLKLFGAHP